MIKVFYNFNGQAEVSENLAILKKISLEDALWIDLFNPTGDEKRAVEIFLHTTLQSRAQAEEIESSSRYSETIDAIFDDIAKFSDGTAQFDDITMTVVTIL